MNEEERRVIVDQEMVKALKFLTDAEELARLEMWNVVANRGESRKMGVSYVVANRAYYALYHAVMAMMVNDGFLPKTHSGLITEFGREYVITGKIDPKYSKVLSQMRSIRENCDYDVFYYTCKEEMEPVLITVRELIELINERINDSASKR